MNDQTTKQAVKIVLEIVSVIGSLYGFWKRHESEIKGIVQPVIKHCIEASDTIPQNGGVIE